MKKIIYLFMAIMLVSPLAYASDKTDAALKLQEANLALKILMNKGDRSIPSSLLAKAQAVAIFPGMFKAGFVLGGTFGRGVVIARLDGEQVSLPAFFTIGGASVGLQIGGQTLDLVLVIMTKKGLEGLLSNKLKLGADVAIVAGPLGRRGEASFSAADLKADVYSYSVSKGMFAGISLEGAYIEPNADWIKAYYGNNYRTRQLLRQAHVISPTPEAQELMITIKSVFK